MGTTECAICRLLFACCKSSAPYCSIFLKNPNMDSESKQMGVPLLVLLQKGFSLSRLLFSWHWQVGVWLNNFNMITHDYFNISKAILISLSQFLIQPTWFSGLLPPAVPALLVPRWGAPQCSASPSASPCLGLVRKEDTVTAHHVCLFFFFGLVFFILKKWSQVEDKVSLSGNTPAVWVPWVKSVNIHLWIFISAIFTDFFFWTDCEQIKGHTKEHSFVMI